MFPNFSPYNKPHKSLVNSKFFSNLALRKFWVEASYFKNIARLKFGFWVFFSSFKSFRMFSRTVIVTTSPIPAALGIPVSGIFKFGSKKKVIRVNAGWVVSGGAIMQHAKPIGDFAFKENPRRPMSIPASVCNAASSIFLWVFAALPNPTSIANFFYVFKKHLLLFSAHHMIIPHPEYIATYNFKEDRA